jgi:hypothetical protein
MDVFTDVLSTVFVSNKSSKANLKLDKNKSTSKAINKNNNIELKINYKDKTVNNETTNIETTNIETTMSSQYDIDSLENYLFETYENLDNYTKNILIVNKYYNNFIETLKELLLHISYNSIANKTKNYSKTITVICNSKNKKIYNKILLEYPNIVFTDFKFFYIDILNDDSEKLNDLIQYIQTCKNENLKNIIIFENPDILQIMLSNNKNSFEFSAYFQILTYVNYDYLHSLDKKSYTLSDNTTPENNNDNNNSNNNSNNSNSNNNNNNNNTRIRDVCYDTVPNIRNIIDKLNSQDWVIFHKKDFEKKSEIVFYNNFLTDEPDTIYKKSKKHTKNKNSQFLKYFNKIHKNIGLRYIILPIDGKN